MQRYFITTTTTPGAANGGGSVIFIAQLPVNLRATPAVSYSGTMSFVIYTVGVFTSTTQPSAIGWSGTNLVQFTINGMGSASSGYGTLFGQTVVISSEL